MFSIKFLQSHFYNLHSLHCHQSANILSHTRAVAPQLVSDSQSFHLSLPPSPNKRNLTADFCSIAMLYESFCNNQAVYPNTMWSHEWSLVLLFTPASEIITEEYSVFSFTTRISCHTILHRDVDGSTWYHISWATLKMFPLVPLLSLSTDLVPMERSFYYSTNDIYTK